MNDTPTPRTDEWLEEEKRNPRISGLGNWLDYCKTLERELTAVTEQRDEAISIIMQIKEQFMNGNDHYDDYHIMGNLAYDFLCR